MLSLTAIEKSFGATRAVKTVTLAAAPGTVLGLAGENGAGKSTLIKIVSGAVRPDQGSIALDGKAIAPRDTNEAISLGISSVFQELTLVRELSVERNLLLTTAPTTPWGSIDRRRARQAALDILARHDLAIDPGARVGDLPLGQQQMLEIVRAVERKPRVLLLDEATSALGASEVAWLADLVGRLRDAGTIVLFISHRWDEIVHFCNRVAVLRNGELVSLAETAAVSEDEAIRLMTGQEAVELSFPDKLHSKDAVALSANAIKSRVLRGVSIEIRKGEILGLGGLVGQGQGSLLEALFGAHGVEGSIGVGGKPLERLTPRRAIAAGLAYVPQERKTEGLLLAKSVAVNMTYAILGQLRAVFGLLDPRYEGELVRSAIGRAQSHARRQRAGAKSQRRQPAKSPAREVAADEAFDPPPQRRHPRCRHRHEAAHLCVDRRDRPPGRRRHLVLDRRARTGRRRPSRHRHAAWPHQRGTQRRRHHGRPDRARLRHRCGGG